MKRILLFLKMIFTNKLYINNILKGDNNMKTEITKVTNEDAGKNLTRTDSPKFAIDPSPARALKNWHDAFCEVSSPIRESFTGDSTKVEKEEFISRMKALSNQELEWLMEVIPVDLCLKKIDRELKKAEEHRNAICDIYKTFA